MSSSEGESGHAAGTMRNRLLTRVHSVSDSSPPPTRSLREVFNAALELELAAARRRVLKDVIGSLREPTVGDLLELLQEDLCRLEPDDPLTVGELVGRHRAGGMTVVQLLARHGLPLADSVDEAPAWLVDCRLSEIEERSP